MIAPHDGTAVTAKPAPAAHAHTIQLPATTRRSRAVEAAAPGDTISVATGKYPKQLVSALKLPGARPRAPS